MERSDCSGGDTVLLLEEADVRSLRAFDGSCTSSCTDMRGAEGKGGEGEGVE